MGLWMVLMLRQFICYSNSNVIDGSFLLLRLIAKNGTQAVSVRYNDPANFYKSNYVTLRINSLQNTAINSKRLWLWRHFKISGAASWPLDAASEENLTERP